MSSIVSSLALVSVYKPIGMQIVGQRWCEMKLLAIAEQLHQIIGAFQHPPGY